MAAGRVARVVVALLLALSGIVMGGVPRAAAAGSSAAPGMVAAPLDCKDAPPKVSPYTSLTWTPAEARTDSDPFKYKYVPPQLAYGWNSTMVTYDTGCKPTDGVLPNIGTGVGNFFGLWLPSILTSASYMAMRSIANPTWLGPLDTAVVSATKEVAEGTWTKWLVVVLLLVGAVLLFRARTGEASGTVTGAVWALLVLVVVTWTTSYPSEAPKLVDDGISTGMSLIADSFDDPGRSSALGGAGDRYLLASGPGTLAPGRPVDPDDPSPGGGPSETPQQRATLAVDRLYGQIWWNTNYRTWAEGMFGNPDSTTAKKYGPELYRATHGSFAIETACKNDAAKCMSYIWKEGMSNDFEKTAEKIKKEDRGTYQYMTGTDWGRRSLTGITGLAVALACIFFLVVAAIGMVLGYLAIRLVIPWSPIVGLIFLFDRMREMAMAGLQKIGQVAVAGPIYLAVSMVVLKFNAAIASSQIHTILKIVLMGVTSVFAWKMTRPGTYMPRFSGARRFAGRALSTAAGLKLGHRPIDLGDGEKPDEAPQPKPGPVHVEETPQVGPRPTTVQLPPGRGAAAETETGVDEVRPTYEQVAQPSTPGTFVARDAGAVTSVSARDRRELSATRNPRQLGAPEAGAQTSAQTSKSTNSLVVYRPQQDEATDDELVPESTAAPWRTVSADVTDERLDRSSPAPWRPGEDEDTSSTPLPAVAPPTAEARPAAEPRIVTASEVEPSREPIEPAAVMVPVATVHADDIDESNVSYGSDGEPEFVIYKPSGSEVRRVVSSDE